MSLINAFCSATRAAAHAIETKLAQSVDRGDTRIGRLEPVVGHAGNGFNGVRHGVADALQSSLEAGIYTALTSFPLHPCKALAREGINLQSNSSNSSPTART